MTNIDFNEESKEDVAFCEIHVEEVVLFVIAKNLLEHVFLDLGREILLYPIVVQGLVVGTQPSKEHLSRLSLFLIFLEHTP